VTTRWPIIVSIALALAGGCRCGPNKPPNAAQQRVDELLSRSHSPAFGDDAPLDEIRRDFKGHRAVLRKELDLPSDLRDLSGERGTRHRNTLIILNAVGTDEARLLIAESAREKLPYLRKVWAQPPPDDGKLPPVEHAMATLFHLALKMLGAKRDPALVDEAFDLLGSSPPPHDVVRINLLQYLGAIAVDDPTILPRLRALLDDKSSPLHGDYELRRKVEFLEKQKTP